MWMTGVLLATAVILSLLDRTPVVPTERKPEQKPLFEFNRLNHVGFQGESCFTSDHCVWTWSESDGSWIMTAKTRGEEQ